MSIRARILSVGVVVVLAAAAILVPAIVLPAIQGDRVEQASLKPEQPAGVVVPADAGEAVPTPAGQAAEYIRLPAEVHAAARVEVFPDTAGTLTSLNVEVGDVVSVEDIVAYVDPSRPGTRFEPSPVRAPIAGTVTVLHRDLGERLAPSTPVLRIETLSQLEVRVDVPERYINLVNGSTHAELRLPALGARTVALQVARMSPVLNPVSRSKEVTFRVDGTYWAPGSEHGIGIGVEPGMFGELYLTNRPLPTQGEDAE